MSKIAASLPTCEAVSKGQFFVIASEAKQSIILVINGLLRANRPRNDDLSLLRQPLLIQRSEKRYAERGSFLRSDYLQLTNLYRMKYKQIIIMRKNFVTFALKIIYSN
jgi:stalled ribosome alternative rescue factor ArfA